MNNIENILVHGTLIGYIAAIIIAGYFITNYVIIFVDKLLGGNKND